MKNILTSFCSLSLIACAPASIIANEPIYDVYVGHELFKVQKITGSQSSWAANKADLSGGLINPEDYRKNITAIEKHTGCSVDIATVVNKGLNTKAMVNC